MSVKIGEMESPNEGLTTVFRDLQLVERPTELARFGTLALFNG